jgi:hypothetical protein
MNPFDFRLSDLISGIDRDRANSTPLTRVAEAQLRSDRLTAFGERLVGFYVAQARQDGASWTDIGAATGVSEREARERWVPELIRDFTDRARHAIVVAQDMARIHRRHAVGTGHLLLGLLGEPAALAAKLLLAKAGSADAVRQAVADRMAEDGAEAPHGQVPFTPQGAQMLTETIREASRLGHDFVGTEHLLLGLLAVQDGTAAAALGALGMDLDNMRPLVAAEVSERMRRNEETS